MIIMTLAYKNACAKTINPVGFGSDATFKSIILSSGTTLVYTSGPSDFNYTTSVSPNTPTISIQGTLNDPGATFTVNGTAGVSGHYTSPITLNGIVTTTINLIVTASDGVTTHSYTITVFETGSNNAYLGALSINPGSSLVNSATGPGTFNYTTSVTMGTSSITVTPVTADNTATVTVNGVAVTSGTASGPVPLNVSPATTTINTVVTAQDGVTKQTYSIIVSQNGSNNATLTYLKVSTKTALTTTSGTSNFNYITTIKNGVTTIQVKAKTADPTATITVNGTVNGNVVVASGAYSPNINVPPGGATITLSVLAGDMVTQETYSIQVVYGALSGSILSSFPLSSNCILVSSGPGSTVNNYTTYNYSTDVNPASGSFTVTPSLALPGSNGASITVNGVAVASGVASNPITLIATGPTPVSIKVIAQDGTDSTNYSLTVNRMGSNDYLFRSIALSSNTILVSTTGPVTSPATDYYQTYVSNTLTALTVTPFLADSVDGTTVTVNTVLVANAHASASIPITNGTVIPLLVTAQDGTQRKTSITVYTTGSNNANLSSITVTSNPTLVSQTTGPGNINYTTSVSSALSSINVTAIASDTTATITYNGSIVKSGTPIPITLGTIGSVTNVLLTVKSPSGTVTKTTNIAITRSANNDANLSSFTLSTKTAKTGTSGPYNANYTSVVSPHTLTLTVTATTIDPNATMTINGLATVSGTPSLPITLNNGTTTIVIMVTAQDGVTSLTTGITILRTGTLISWTGAATALMAGTTLLGDWRNTGNWNPVQVPTASDVAIFGETAFTGVNQPLIVTDTNVGEIDFGSATNTTLTVTSNTTLTVGSNLTVDNGATATINASSTPHSSVNIAATGSLNFPDATSSGAPGTGKLNIISPVALTLQSSAAGSASIGQITTSSIAGIVSVQRYISGGSSVYRGYRLLSSAVYQGSANSNNIYSLNYVQETSLVLGVTGTTGGFYKIGNPSLFLYREDRAPSNATFTSGNYSGISNIIVGTPVVVNNSSYNYAIFNYYLNYYINNGSTAYNIPVGNGFMFFFRGDYTNIGNKFTAGTIAESVTMTTTGTLNAGPITVHDWYTPSSGNIGFTNTTGNSTVQGFNLVGNPYASNIDWDTYSTTTATAGIYAPGVGSSIYVLDPVSKNYGVYMANSSLPGTNNATHIIASGQGFFVQAQSAAATLTFNESAKTTIQVTSPQLLLGKPAADAVNQYIRLKLQEDSVQADEVYINFNNGATSKFVMTEDAAQKPGFGDVGLASMSSDGVPLSINTLKLPKQSQSETIALNVNATANGTYQLSMPEVKSVPALFDIWLMDSYKKDSVNLRQKSAYSFTIAKGDSASYGSGRFTVVIRQNPALAVRLLNFAAAKATGGAQVVWKTENEENYTNFTVERSTDGGVTFNELGGFVSDASATYGFLDKNPLITADRYRLKLEDLNGTISYSAIVTLMYSELSSNIAGNINIYPNPASSVINLSITPFNSATVSQANPVQGIGIASTAVTSTVSYGIKIINISGSVIRTATSSSPAWQDNVSSLAPGTYIIQVVNNSNKSLVGKSTFIKL